jgi:DNA-binding response OmpR family regulator
MFDQEARNICRDGRVLELRRKEFELLSYLCLAPGKVVSKALLLRDVWGFKCAAATRTIDFHIAQLRSKIEVDPSRPEHLLTVRGVGYRLITGP